MNKYQGFQSSGRKSLDETKEILSERANFSSRKKISEEKRDSSLTKMSKLDMIMRNGRQEVSQDNGSKLAIRIREQKY